MLPIDACRCDERLKTKHCSRGSEIVVYYESIKREIKIRCIYECRCDERLQTKTKEFTRLSYTGLVVELEHLRIETRLNDKVCSNVFDNKRKDRKVRGKKKFFFQKEMVRPTSMYRCDMKVCLLQRIKREFIYLLLRDKSSSK